eukprot:6483652-Amphidinium_carterae.1
MANPCWQPLPNCLAALTYATRSFARGPAAIEVTATPYTPAEVAPARANRSTRTLCRRTWAKRRNLPCMHFKRCLNCVILRRLVRFSWPPNIRASRV